MTTSEIDDTLHSLIFSDEKIVTYRYLSRKLKIHVNAAKEHLYSFSKKNEGKLHATYVVSGVYSAEEPSVSSVQSSMDEKDAQRDIYGFQMVPQENLDEEMKRFKRVSSVHVYSLGVVKSNDPQLLSVSYNGVNELDNQVTLNDLYKLGMVRNTILSEEMTSKPRVSLKTPSPKPEQVVKPTGGAKKETELQKSEVLTNTKGSLEAAFARSRKPASKPASRPAAKPATKTATSAKGKASKPVKAETKQQAEQKKKQMEELQKMFEESSDEEMPDVSEAIDKSEEQKAAAETETPESQDIEMKEASAEPEPEKVVETTNTGRKKVRRKVKKTVTKQTPDGYLETQVVEEFETASEDEKESTPQPKKTAPAPKKPAPKKGGKKKTGQATLMSFFGQ